MKPIFIILITILWIVVRIVKAAQKQQQAQQNSPAPTRSGPQQQQATKTEEYTIESLLKGLVGEPTKPQRQEESYFSEAGTSKPEQIENENTLLYPDAMDKDVLEALMKEGHSGIKDKKLEVEELGEGESLELDFDLRKAVLFSEILNNPFLERNY